MNEKNKAPEERLGRRQPGAAKPGQRGGPERGQRLPRVGGAAQKRRTARAEAPRSLATARPPARYWLQHHGQRWPHRQHHWDPEEGMRGLPPYLDSHVMKRDNAVHPEAVDRHLKDDVMVSLCLRDKDSSG